MDHPLVPVREPGSDLCTTRPSRSERTASTVLTRLAAARLRQGRPAQAADAALHLLSLDPSDFQARCLLGVALLESGRPREAARYLVGGPCRPEFLIVRGLADLALGHFADSEDAARSAAAMLPDDPEPLRLLGSSLAAQRRYAEALKVLGRALELAPDHAEARLARAAVRRELGDPTGWSEFDWRFKTHHYRSMAPAGGVSWDGQALKAGQVLNVIAEPSDSDSLFFARFIPLLAGHADRIVASCPPGLASLFGTVAGLDQTFTGSTLRNQTGVPARRDEAFIHLGSLPDRLKLSFADVPSSPYLSADPLAVRRYRERLASRPGLKVAIHWRSEPDDRRSYPCAVLRPIGSLEGVRLMSVQTGDGSEELAEAGLPLAADLSLDLSVTADRAGSADYKEVAAALTAVDLIITNDGPTAHLAGALGRPCWVALPVGPEWYWAGEGVDTPWYPSLRLFRQSSVSEWSDVFEAMHLALRLELAERAARFQSPLPIAG